MGATLCPLPWPCRSSQCQSRMGCSQSIPSDSLIPNMRTYTPSTPASLSPCASAPRGLSASSELTLLRWNTQATDIPNRRHVDGFDAAKRNPMRPALASAPKSAPSYALSNVPYARDNTTALITDRAGQIGRLCHIVIRCLTIMGLPDTGPNRQVGKACREGRVLRRGRIDAHTDVSSTLEQVTDTHL